MNKFIVLLLVAVSLLVSVGLNSKNADQTKSASVNPLVTPTPLAEILSLELDKKEALYACPYHFLPNSCGKDENGVTKKDNLLITVKPLVRNPKNTQVFYEYKVTGGRILGQGREVLWNLDGARPGVYTITAWIRGERRVSVETKTESVTVTECEFCDIPCIPCPTLAVEENEELRASEYLIFSAKTLGGPVDNFTYQWTISQGEIAEGQGTSQIKVKITPEMSRNINATVKLEGLQNHCQPCMPTASLLVTIIK
jgi:hypothetical protein